MKGGACLLGLGESVELGEACAEAAAAGHGARGVNHVALERHALQGAHTVSLS